MFIGVWLLVLTVVHNLTLIITRTIFLVLGEGPTVDINNSVGAAEQSTNFSKAEQILLGFALQ